MRKLVPVLITLLVSCHRKPLENPVENIPPETYLYVEGRVDTVPARVALHWYGNDPDGYVVGFYYHWDDEPDTVFTTANSDTFSLSSAGSVQVHVFKIWALDNEGAVDPTPASVTIPVINSPPTIQFQYGTLPPDTILPVATYYLEWHDVDGDSTVTGYYWKVNNGESHFVSVDSPSVTITDFSPGQNVVYFWAEDENSAVSDTIADTVFVIPVTGRILLVDDDPDVTADEFYSRILDSLGYEYTLWRVDRGLPYSPVDQRYVINNFGFQLIIWYTGETQSHVKDIYRYLLSYLDNGNKLMLTGSGVFIDLDSTSLVANYMNIDSLIPDKTILPGRPVFRVYNDPQYPDTLITRTLIARMDGFVVHDPAVIVYRTTVLGINDPVAVMLKSPENNPQIVVFSLKVHKLGGDLGEFFRHVISDEFGIN